MAASRCLLLLPPSPFPKPPSSQSTTATSAGSRRARSLRRFPRFRRGAAPTERAQDVLKTASDDEGVVSTVVSSLLFLAFAGLLVLTVGVIYLAVQDFLQKRETEKFEKEEAGRTKKQRKKKVKVKSKSKAKVRAGPRGFGQKLVEEEEEDD